MARWHGHASHDASPPPHTVERPPAAPPGTAQHAFTHMDSPNGHGSSGSIKPGPSSSCGKAFDCAGEFVS